MKYKDTTQEQRESITPYLKKLLIEKYHGIKHDMKEYVNDINDNINAYQQAQKAEVEFLHEKYFSDDDLLENDYYNYINERLAKLKFESELE